MTTSFVAEISKRTKWICVAVISQSPWTWTTSSLMLTGTVMLQTTWTIGLAVMAYTGPPDVQGFGVSWIVFSVIAWSVRVADSKM